MFNNKNTFSRRGDARLIAAMPGAKPVPACGAWGAVNASRTDLHPEHAPARRAWRTHAYRDSQVIFFGHEMASACLGQLSG
jgi:hypothetical protein